MDRLAQTIADIDLANGEDPNMELVGEQSFPKELLYSQRMTEILAWIEPMADETLKIATRAQHIRRWSIPRSDYPMDRKGYLKWRTVLKLFHADETEKIMRKYGYNDAEVADVRAMLIKTNLKTDPHCRTLEDVACLVFLKYYYADFLEKHEEDKIIDILRKTWQKMTPKGHDFALKLPISGKGLELVKKALS
jgi:Domain of unknown function (DUF4202)